MVADFSKPLCTYTLVLVGFYLGGCRDGVGGYVNSNQIYFGYLNVRVTSAVPASIHKKLSGLRTYPACYVAWGICHAGVASNWSLYMSTEYSFGECS